MASRTHFSARVASRSACMWWCGLVLDLPFAAGTIACAADSRLTAGSFQGLPFGRPHLCATYRDHTAEEEKKKKVSPSSHWFTARLLAWTGAGLGMYFFFIKKKVQPSFYKKHITDVTMVRIQKIKLGLPAPIKQQKETNNHNHRNTKLE